MSKSRSELRDIACRILYETYIFDNAKITYNLDELIHDEIEDVDDFVSLLVHGVSTHQEEIVHLANCHLVDWEIDRLSKIDKAILSIGIYELLYTDTPGAVVINEAMLLSHKYSDDSVSKMINATLDKVYKERVK